MPTHSVRTSALAALLAALCACGSDSSVTPDNYNGPIDASALDTKLLPTAKGATCLTGSCYPAQQGYAKGNPYYFYNLGAVSGSPNPAIVDPTIGAIRATLADHLSTGAGGAHVDNFPAGCAPDKTYDQRLDAFKSDHQFPLFDSLPLLPASTSAIAVPLVALYTVSGLTDNVCNDIKDTRSVANAGDIAAGKFGARRSAKPTSYQVWGVIDQSFPINNIATIPATTTATGTTPAIPPNGGTCVPGQANCLNQNGWYKGLQLQFLNGGLVPPTTTPDPANPGQAIATLGTMEGVIVDPAGSGFAKPTDTGAVLLPATFGDDSYSPIVRLHDYRLQAGETLATYKGVCALGQTCPANYVAFKSAANCPSGTAGCVVSGSSTFNVIFIAAGAQ